MSEVRTPSRSSTCSIFSSTASSFSEFVFAGAETTAKAQAAARTTAIATRDESQRRRGFAVGIGMKRRKTGYGAPVTYKP
jgi:hypothetical protein